MISQFFILTPRGDTVVSKDYRGDCPRGEHSLANHHVEEWKRWIQFLKNVRVLACADGDTADHTVPPLSLSPNHTLCSTGTAEIFFRKLKSYERNPPPIFVRQYTLLCCGVWLQCVVRV